MELDPFEIDLWTWLRNLVVIGTFGAHNRSIHHKYNLFGHE